MEGHFIADGCDWGFLHEFSSHDTLGLHCLGCHMLSHCLGSVTGLNLSQLSASDPVGRLCTWVRGTGPTAPCAAR